MSYMFLIFVFYTLTEFYYDWLARMCSCADSGSCHLFKGFSGSCADVHVKINGNTDVHLQ